MARGWESKSIESQQQDLAAGAPPGKPRLTVGEANRLREQESLRLALQQVMEQLRRSRDARHRALLERAQADLESKLQKLAL